MTDKNNMMRVGQRLAVEIRSPEAVGPGGWQPVWDAEVLEVSLAAGANFNTARIYYPRLRWNDPMGLAWGSQVRIRTTVPTKNNGEPLYAALQPTVLFQGFAVQRRFAFSGGDEKAGAFERAEILCADYRWFLSRRISLIGQYARSADDQTFQCTWMSGRRAIFNESGGRNRDANYYDNPPALPFPIFGKDEYWTAQQMLDYLMANTIIRQHITAVVTASDGGLEATPHHVIIDTLDAVTAILRVLGPLGWTMREQYTMDGPVWVLYKAGRAAQTSRTAAAPTILHTLYAPMPGEMIPQAVAAGKKMLHAGTLTESIYAVVNAPYGLGSPMRFEATFYLVPGWEDADLVPDSGSSYANLYLTEQTIQTTASPDAYSFYAQYHAGGASFLPDVGRKWVLNEAGDYTASPYSRGDAFDFATVIPASYILQDGRRIYGLFKRRFLECLTFDQTNINSVGIRAEVSLDGGSTWQDLGASGAIRNLPNECGIRIEDPNLSEILDKQARTIASGALAGKERNYWVSLADDKVNSRTWPNWNTRVRVTASVVMDQRILRAAEPTAGSGSPFRQARVYDFSGEFTFSLRTAASGFYSSGLPAWNTNEYEKLADRTDALRDANEDKSVSGPLVLDRLWLGDGAGQPEFAVGDGIAGIKGRDYGLGSSVRGDAVYPEIVQIIYDPQSQQQTLVMRDVRMGQLKMGR